MPPSVSAPNTASKVLGSARRDMCTVVLFGSAVRRPLRHARLTQAICQPRHAVRHGHGVLPPIEDLLEPVAVFPPPPPPHAPPPTPAPRPHNPADTRSPGRRRCPAWARPPPPHRGRARGRRGLRPAPPPRRAGVRPGPTPETRPRRDPRPAEPRAHAWRTTRRCGPPRTPLTGRP